MRALARAYLDAQQPGFALALIEAAPAPSRADARTRHLEARALLDLGRNDAALAAEASVVASCVDPVREGEQCDGLLLASALRRAAILKELLSLGVEDTRAHPEASLVAYQNATREARVMVQ
jgi:hypothetical protein